MGSNCPERPCIVPDPTGAGGKRMGLPLRWKAINIRSLDKIIRKMCFYVDQCILMFDPNIFLDSFPMGVYSDYLYAVYISSAVTY